MPCKGRENRKGKERKKKPKWAGFSAWKLSSAFGTLPLPPKAGFLASAPVRASREGRGPPASAPEVKSKNKQSLGI